MLQRINTNTGKVTIATILLSVFVIAFVFFFDVQHGGHIQKATADSATTSVTVINIPPQWTGQATESPASTSTSPTNVGAPVTFIGTGTDGNGEPYYLLICKNSGAPTPNVGAHPECNGGSGNRWAVSTSTISGTQASASYTALAGDSETEDWYAWICDGNLGNPSCNATYSGHETGADNKSPFSVNHAPTFTAYQDDSPILPGNAAGWTTTAADPDSNGGADQVRLFVCKANDFTGSACGTGGTWATSTLSTINPAATTTVPIPTQDGNLAAYGYIIDEHGLVASGGSHGTDSVFVVQNATSTVSNVTLIDSPIILTTEEGETTGFTVSFDVTDDNSCVANGSTTYEISSADISVYRSGIGSSSCQASGHYNANNCYPGTVATGVWNVVCTQNNSTCNGPTDDTVTWNCVYPLWYIADPTTAGSQYFGQTWMATALAVDDNSVTSSVVEAGSGVQLQQLLAFDVATTSIAYGSFEPGQGNASTSVITDLRATGNVGLDESLYGTDMCPGYPATCSGLATSTIPVPQQHFSTSNAAYALGTALATTTQELELNLAKTTSTSSPQTANTYWGIQIPVALTLSGDYKGENTLIGVVGESVDW